MQTTSLKTVSPTTTSLCIIIPLTTKIQRFVLIKYAVKQAAMVMKRKFNIALKSRVVKKGLSAHAQLLGMETSLGTEE